MNDVDLEDFWLVYGGGETAGEMCLRYMGGGDSGFMFMGGGGLSCGGCWRGVREADFLNEF